MRWSWKVGHVAGIELRLHATFFALIAWVAWVYYQTFGARSAGFSVLLTAALFASIVLHELGHAIAARRFAVTTRDITLLPIGGVAHLDSLPTSPRAELAIALAGPAVTLVITALLAGVLWIAEIPTAIGDDALAHYSVNTLIAQLMWLNASLLLFNAIPAFPMDGGRVLRALLAMRRGYDDATDSAARLGKIFAVLFGAAGLLYSPILVLVAVFVWVGATTESFATHERLALQRVTVSQLMVRNPVTLAPHDSLRSALEHIVAGFQHDFPVLSGGKVVGVLTRRGLLSGLAHRGELSLVSTSMDAVFRTARPEEAVAEVLARLRTCACHTSPIVDGTTLVGVLTTDNVGEFVMLETARRHAPPASSARARRANRPRPAMA